MSGISMPVATDNLVSFPAEEKPNLLKSFLSVRLFDVHNLLILVLLLNRGMGLPFLDG